LSKHDNPSAPPAIALLLLLAMCAAVLFISFIALGTWQVKRLYWKHALIERVEHRVHAPAVAAPEPEEWNKVTRESDEYRRVRVSGIFLDQLSTKVEASTILGRGWWVMTPLRLTNRSIIFINRGFIAYGASPCTSSSDSIEVTGLLRLSEPGGAFLRPNNPVLQKWYSRDIAAFAASKQLSNVAPFFIDAEAEKNAHTRKLNCADPVAGLTVIAFSNNHLIYAITWYTLALMVVIAGFIVGHTELKQHMRLNSLDTLRL